VAFVGFVSAKMYISTLKSNLKSARKKADIVVAHFHWTDVREFRYSYPTSRQKSLAQCRHQLRRGSGDRHPHPRGSTHRALRGKYIVYDQGNFVTSPSNPSISSTRPTSGRYDYDSFFYSRISTSGGRLRGTADYRSSCSIPQTDELINNAQPTPMGRRRRLQRVRNNRNHSIGIFRLPVNRDGLRRLMKRS
jgi:hypothetical protein